MWQRLDVALPLQPAAMMIEGMDGLSSVVRMPPHQHE